VGVQVASEGITWARLRASRMFSKIGKVLFAVSLAAVYSMPLLLEHGTNAAIAAPIAGGMGFTAMFGVFITSFILWFVRNAQRGSVAVDDAAVRVTRDGKGERTIARSAITSAFVVGRPLGAYVVPTVEILLADGDVVSVRTSTEPEAHALVDALGYGPGGKRVTVPLDQPARRLFNLLIGGASYYLGGFLAMPFMIVLGIVAASVLPHGHDATGSFGALIGPFALLSYWLLSKLLRPPTLTIGDDGLTYTAGRRKTFIPRANIASIEQSQPGLPLVIRPTSALPIVVNGSVLDIHRRAAAARLAYDRLVAAPRPPEPSAVFQREGRSVAEWRAHLRGLFDTAGYRTAGASVEEATAVLRSAASSPEQRVGAALALREAGEPKERIRVAAEAAADDRVRVVLEAVAEAEDDAPIEKALKRLV
jgi:hypothetical protein